MSIICLLVYEWTLSPFNACYCSFMPFSVSSQTPHSSGVALDVQRNEKRKPKCRSMQVDGRHSGWSEDTDRHFWWRLGLLLPYTNPRSRVLTHSWWLTIPSWILRRTRIFHHFKVKKLHRLAGYLDSVFRLYLPPTAIKACGSGWSHLELHWASTHNPHCRGQPCTCQWPDSLSGVRPQTKLLTVGVEACRKWVRGGKTISVEPITFFCLDAGTSPSPLSDQTPILGIKRKQFFMRTTCVSYASWEPVDFCNPQSIVLRGRRHMQQAPSTKSFIPTTFSSLMITWQQLETRWFFFVHLEIRRKKISILT